MRIGFYMKLAANGMKKNGKFYIPYLLTCICTIAMCYIVSALSVSPTLAAMRGGDMLISLLKLGVWVIIIFSVLLLSYTNSFLRKNGPGNSDFTTSSAWINGTSVLFYFLKP